MNVGVCYYYIPRWVKRASGSRRSRRLKETPFSWYHCIYGNNPILEPLFNRSFNFYAFCIFCITYIYSHFWNITLHRKKKKKKKGGREAVESPIAGGERVEWEKHVSSVLTEGFLSLLENVATRNVGPQRYNYWWGSSCLQSGNHHGHAGDSDGRSSLSLSPSIRPTCRLLNLTAGY